MGALSLNTSSLKSQLKRECSAWKTKYCQNLHRQAKDSLESLTEYMRVSANRGRKKCRGITNHEVSDAFAIVGLREGRSKEKGPCLWRNAPAIRSLPLWEIQLKCIPSGNPR